MEWFDAMTSTDVCLSKAAALSLLSGDCQDTRGSLATLQSRRLVDFSVVDNNAFTLAPPRRRHYSQHPFASYLSSTVLAQLLQLSRILHPLPSSSSLALHHKSPSQLRTIPASDPFFPARRIPRKPSDRPRPGSISGRMVR